MRINRCEKIFFIPVINQIYKVFTKTPYGLNLYMIITSSEDKND